jgi:hypothetical protein
MAETEADLTDLIGRLGLGSDVMSAADFVLLPGEGVLEQHLTDDELVAVASAAVTADVVMDEVVAVLDWEGEEEEEEMQAPPSLHTDRQAAATIVAFVGAHAHLFMHLSWDVEMGMSELMSVLNKACVASLRNLRQADIRAFFTAPTAEPMSEEPADTE